MWGISWVPWGISWVPWGYLEYRGVFSTVGYSNNKRNPPTVLNTLHGTHDIPHIHHDIPTVLPIPHGTQDNPLRYSWYPHGTEHPPPMVLKISPHLLWYPHGTEHTLYRVITLLRVDQNCSVPVSNKTYRRWKSYEIIKFDIKVIGLSKLSLIITCCAKLHQSDWLQGMQLIRNCTGEIRAKTCNCDLIGCFCRAKTCLYGMH